MSTRTRSRRDAIGVSALALLGGAAFALGCEPNAARPSTELQASPAPQAAVRRGGVLRMSQASDLVPEAGHPFALVAQNRILAYATNETAIQYLRELSPSPLLAERFELSPDRTRAAMTLKPGVEFHNGARLSAQDVLFSLEALRSPERHGLPRSLELSRLAQGVTIARATGALTVEVEFDRPRANAQDLFAQMHVVHHASYGSSPESRFVGTGPFRLDSWKRGEGYTLRAYRNWHGATDGQPYLDAIDVSITPDLALAPSRIQGGVIDAQFAVGAPNAAVSPRELVRVAPKTGMQYLGMNVTSPALRDVRVRQAIYWSLDRQRMFEVAGGRFGTVTTQPWGPASPAFDAAREAAAFYDVPEARRLLAAAGFRHGAPLLLEYPAGASAQEFQAEIVRANLASVGIAVELRPTDGAQFTAKFRGAGFEDLWLAGHAFADLTPVTLFEQAHEFSTPNVSKFESGRYRSLVSDLQALDPGSAAALTVYRELNRLMVEDPWLVPTGVPQVRLDLVGRRVQGWPATAQEYVLAITGKTPFGQVWIAT